jgi:hypothetical protein
LVILNADCVPILVYKDKGPGELQNGIWEATIPQVMGYAQGVLGARQITHAVIGVGWICAFYQYDRVLQYFEQRSVGRPRYRQPLDVLGDAVEIDRFMAEIAANV